MESRNIKIFLRVFDVTNQLLIRHSLFVPLCQVDESLAERSLFFNPELFVLEFVLKTGCNGKEYLEYSNA